MAPIHLKPWKISVGPGKPLMVIAGLNVLEDLEMALDVAGHLKAVTSELGLPFVFKASFDKANRSSISSYRGPGLEPGLAMLAEVKRVLRVPIATDVHAVEEVERVAAVADLVQIPAFLCRQTDLVTAAARAVSATGGCLHIKKGQFLAPWDCRNILAKAREAAPDVSLILCERGTSFGYNNLVTDMIGIDDMRRLGVPVSIDATHAAQLPGADAGTNGAATGGRRAAVPLIAQAAVAVGADAVFLEFHRSPEEALCDGPSCLPLGSAAGLLATLKAISEIVRL